MCTCSIVSLSVTLGLRVIITLRFCWMVLSDRAMVASEDVVNNLLIPKFHCLCVLLSRKRTSEVCSVTNSASRFIVSLIYIDSLRVRMSSLVSLF